MTPEVQQSLGPAQRPVAPRSVINRFTGATAVVTVAVSGVYVMLSGCLSSYRPGIDPVLVAKMEEDPNAPFDLEKTPKGSDILPLLREGKECKIGSTFFKIEDSVFVMRNSEGKTSRVRLEELRENIFNRILAGKIRCTLCRSNNPSDGSSECAKASFACSVDNFLAGFANLDEFTIHTGDVESMLKSLLDSQEGARSIECNLVVKYPNGKTGTKLLEFRNAN